VSGSSWSNQAISLIVLTEQTTGFSGLFGYSPSVGAGNLIFSVAAKAGTDPYGNAYPQGLSSTTGSISGTDINIIGSDGGLFGYTGAPALGNIIFALAASAGTDPYGNTYPQGFALGIPGAASQIELSPAPSSGSVSSVSFPMPTTALTSAPNISAGLTGTVPALEISGPELSAASHQDWVQAILWGNDGGSTPARWEFRRIDTSGGVVVTASYNSGGWTFADPVSFTGSVTVSYAWQAISLLNGWGTQAGYGARYRISNITNSVEVQANLTAGTLTGGTSIGTVAAAYRPAASFPVGPLIQEAGANQNTQLMPRVDLTTGGSLVIFNVSANTTNCSLHGFVPLD
jgi:hypothetical protein